MWAIDALQLAIALALDVLMGDPRRGPHVTRLAGILASRTEESVRAIVSPPWLAGVVHWAVVCGFVTGGCGLVIWLLAQWAPGLAWAIEIVLIYQTIGATDLCRHARAVAEPLARGRIEEARTKLGRLVGRDTDALDESEMARATIESVAEGSHDGLVGPLFWGVVGGVPGAVLYRTANTLDSMVGYPSGKYREFGWAAARADDLLSWIPARLTALTFWIMGPRASWRALADEAGRHASPNAGWSEAAMAYSLGVRLGGTNRYGGIARIGPVFCPAGRAAEVGDIGRSIRCFSGMSIALGVLVIGIAMTRDYL